jgi:predicted PurR-regulated permease PerM
MPRSKKTKLRKFLDELPTGFSIVLGLAASIPINLASTWFQQYILSNTLFSVVAIILVLGFLYWIIELRSRTLIIATITLIVSVIANLLSSWIQDKRFHNSFSLENVVIILCLAFLGLMISAFPLSKYIRSMTKTRRVRTVTLRTERKTSKTSKRLQNVPRRRQQRKPRIQQKQTKPK